MENSKLFHGKTAAVFEGKITVDKIGIILSADSATQKIFGYNKEGLIGQNISLLIPTVNEINIHITTPESSTNQLLLSEEIIKTQGRNQDKICFPIRLYIQHGLHESVYTWTKVKNTAIENHRRTIQNLQNEKEELIFSLENEKKLSRLKNRILEVSTQELQNSLNVLQLSVTEVENYLRVSDHPQIIQNLHKIRNSISSLKAVLQLFPNQKDSHSEKLQGTEELDAFTELWKESRFPDNQISQNSAPGIRELNKTFSERKIRTFRKKQTIYYQGDGAINVYFILEGTVKTTKMTVDGKELVTGVYGKGDYFGITSLLAGTDYRENAEVLTDATVSTVSKESIERLLKRYPEIAEKFTKILANHVIDNEELLLQLAYSSVRKRLAEVLLKLHAKHTKGSFDISRENLASMSGSAIETVSRILTEFKEENLIGRSAHKITILDEPRLRDLKN